MMQLANAALLVSPWKPLLIWGGFMAWAWLVSDKLDKDARYLNFNWKTWNSMHLSAGVAALAVMFTAWNFWVSFPVGIIILLIPILVYWRVRNQAVPEDRRYHLSFRGDEGDKVKRRQEKARQAAVLNFSDNRGQDLKVPDKDDPAFQVYLQVEDIIGPAINARASRVEMALTDAGCRTSRTIDGIRVKQEPIDTEQGIPVFNFLRSLSGLDPTETRRKKVGTFSLTGPLGETQAHLTASGSSKGQLIQIEFNREQSRLVPYDQLGLIPQQCETLDSLVDVHDRHGIVLVTAPSGQGGTTTAYSLLGRHDAYTCNIKSLEYEIEAYVNGVDQVEWDPLDIDIDFATNLQSILRRDPDIVLTGPIKDSDTARTAIAPGRQGPLIYVMMEAPSIVAAIREWVKFVGDVDEAIKPLRAVTNQRLLRKLCPNCRQPMSPQEVAALNLPSGIGKEICRAVGQVQNRNKVEDCPVCFATGYLGLTGAFEVFNVDKEIRTHLRGGDLKTAMAQARRGKMLLLQEAGLWKAGQGHTSLKEVARVLSTDKKKASKPGAETKAGTP